MFAIIFCPLLLRYYKIHRALRSGKKHKTCFPKKMNNAILWLKVHFIVFPCYLLDLDDLLMVLTGGFGLNCDYDARRQFDRGNFVWKIIDNGDDTWIDITVAHFSTHLLYLPFSIVIMTKEWWKDEVIFLSVAFVLQIYRFLSIVISGRANH